MSRLAGKTALVTGAAQGIGLAIAQAFAREGATVIATDLRQGALDLAYAGTSITLARMDVTDAAEVERVAAAHPAVDVMVNCAGWVATGSIVTAQADDLSRSFAINVQSMANTIRAFLPAMLGARGGSIVNIASVVSSVAAAPDRFAYATTKAAVIGLTMSVARDFITQGVRCNAISPGTVDSPSLTERLRASGDEESARRTFVARQPMGRIGQVDEIAAVAVMLASDEARFMTGANIVIDGGMSL